MDKQFAFRDIARPEQGWWQDLDSGAGLGSIQSDEEDMVARQLQDE